MKVVILGTAAGGGFPQWNCACQNCAGGTPSRSQDCVAVTADGTNWYLVNASPDIRAQILATRALAAGPRPRETPICGLLLTDAELDHVLGLLMLRESNGLPVWAPKAALDTLQDAFPVQHILNGYGSWDWRPVEDATTLGALRVRALPVSDKRPKYAGKSTEDSPWVVAYRIEDPATGGVLVYAPCLANWPPGFNELTADASYVLLDGTFYSPAELSGTIRTPGTDKQRAMGHLPIAGEDGSLALIQRQRTAHPDVQWGYTHLNNTNPLLNPESAECREVLAAGIELPADGTELLL